MTMAFRTDMPPVRKFVLLAMCDMANVSDNGLTYPSIATVARHCSLDRRTVERAIKELEADGYLSASRRAGMKSRYQINVAKLNQASIDYLHERDSNPRQRVAGGEKSQAADNRDTCDRESHPPTAESRSTYGRESHITRSNQNDEPEDNRKEAGAKRAHVSRPDSVSVEVWNDFQAIRKAKRSPLTETALIRMEAEAKKAGISLQEAFTVCCVKGWQSFSADWYANSASAKGRRVPVRENFDAIDYGPPGVSPL